MGRNLSPNLIPQNEAFCMPWYMLENGSRPFVIVAMTRTTCPKYTEEVTVQYVASRKNGVKCYPLTRIKPFNMETPEDIMEMMVKKNDTVYQVNIGNSTYDCYLVGTSSRGEKVVEFIDDHGGYRTNVFQAIPYTTSITPKPVAKVIKCSVWGKNTVKYYTLPKSIKTEIKAGTLLWDDGSPLSVLEVDVEKTDPGVFDLYKDMPEFKGVQLVTKDL